MLLRVSRWLVGFHPTVKLRCNGGIHPTFLGKCSQKCLTREEIKANLPGQKDSAGIVWVNY